MAEKEDDSKVNSLQFLEVTCENFGKASRFAAGTKAGFAVYLINKKLERGSQFVSHIEAVKDGEEPISFGPDALLVDYGVGWKLQTVSEIDFGVRKREGIRLVPPQVSNMNTHGSQPAMPAPKPGSLLYVAKILLAFILIFVLGAIFTFALENLPGLILHINSYM